MPPALAHARSHAFACPYPALARYQETVSWQGGNTQVMPGNSTKYQALPPFARKHFFPPNLVAIRGWDIPPACNLSGRPPSLGGSRLPGKRAPATFPASDPQVDPHHFSRYRDYQGFVCGPCAFSLFAPEQHFLSVLMEQSAVPIRKSRFLRGAT